MWPILLFAAIALAVVVVGSVMEGRRRKTLADFARRIGFRFDPGAGGFDPEQFHGYTPFEQGGSRRASNAIEGSRGGVDWLMFDYRFTTGSGKNRRTHHYGVVAAKVGL